MLTVLVLSAALSTLTGASAFVRARLFERRGCPRCGGRLARQRDGFGCPPCQLTWTRTGRRIGHSAAAEQIPRAAALPSRRQEPSPSRE